MRWLSAAVLLSLSCSEATNPTGPVGAGASIALSEAVLDLMAHESRTLTVVDGFGSAVTNSVVWSSSDTTVVRVDGEGLVTGAKHGSARIEARVGELTASAPVSVTGFVMPLQGVLNEDFYFHSYMDVGAGPVFQDYNCGEKAYDGHLGVDIVIQNFTRMDQGVNVVAAARGTVVATHDGEFDRQVEWLDGVTSNSVAINHAEGYETRYFHFKKNSVAVSVGEEVVAGTVLGQVGSSGISTRPHLHFELRRFGEAVSSFSGPCGDQLDYWAETLPYQDEFHLIQLDVTNRELQRGDLKQGVPSLDTLYTSDFVATFWFELHNVQARVSSSISIYRPDGTLFRERTHIHPSFASRYTWWYWWFVPTLGNNPGTWTVDYSYGGVMYGSKQFELVAATRPHPIAGRTPSGESRMAGSVRF